MNPAKAIEALATGALAGQFFDLNAVDLNKAARSIAQRTRPDDEDAAQWRGVRPSPYYFPEIAVG